jgi:osmotically-inducible protein OsmY
MRNQNERRRNSRQENQSYSTQERDNPGRFRNDPSDDYSSPYNGKRNSYNPERRNLDGDVEENDQEYSNARGLYGDRDGRSQSGNSQYGSGNYSSTRGENQGRDWGRGLGWDQDNSSYGSQISERNQRLGSYSAGSTTYGEHKGKGPKGYERSDQRIQENINDQLSDDDQLDASEIEVKVEKGEVILSGTVSDRSSKRRAEDIAESVSGVKHVENRIRISSQSSTDSKSTSPGSSSHNKSETSMSGSERSKSK